MKNLKLKDGSAFSFTDTSTIFDLVGVYAKYEEMDRVRAHLTIENLADCEFNEQHYTDLIPVGVSASSDMEGNITAIFSIREKTDIEKIQDRLATHDDEITEIQEVLVEG